MVSTLSSEFENSDSPFRALGGIARKPRSVPVESSSIELTDTADIYGLVAYIISRKHDHIDKAS